MVFPAKKAASTTSFGGNLLYYRLYFWGRTSARIAGFEEFEADNDEAALALAPDYERGLAMELWNEGRMVAAFPDRARAA